MQLRLAKALAASGVRAQQFDNGGDLLAHSDCFDFDCYLLKPSPGGVELPELVRILRRRTAAAIVVMGTSSTAPAFARLTDLGVDRVISRTTPTPKVMAVIEAVLCRVAAARTAVVRSC